MSESHGSRRNALAKSRSPYLLQHAGNPVDWMEWGIDAFEEASRRDAPIFLSIGYSTCHWCHVMAHESFEDEAIAARLNELFVNVKLDREERPDVDRLYMAYVQSTTGSGGWPMSVWLTPDLEPFYGGTYFPPEDRYGRVGFLTLIERIGQLWKDDRSQLIGYGKKSIELLSSNASMDLSDGIEAAAGAIENCLEELEDDYDPVYGGFGGAPKFPMPSYFALLTESASRSGNTRHREILEQSLEKMALGGIWDHVGGGFHRYSVDKYWHIPHYEKMLYDQGQLAASYAEAHRLTGNPDFATVARRIVQYVARDLCNDAGGLLAAEDADSQLPEDASQHGEGAFYTWRERDLSMLLGDDFKWFRSAYSVHPNGNARPESDPHGELRGVNTLAQAASAAALANEHGLSESELRERMDKALSVLFKHREQRPRPHLDDKVVASWSGYMISGACKVYQLCGDDEALALAEKALAFVFCEMWDEDTQTLYRACREGRGEVRGFAEDYASMTNACLDLYESAFSAKWLKCALQLADALISRFEDPDRGGYFASEQDESINLPRLRDDYDGAEPSASSLAALGFLRLAAVTDQSALRDKARRCVEAFGQQWKRAPRAMPLMLVAASRFLESDQQIVIVGDFSDTKTQALSETARRWRKPYSVLIGIDASQQLPPTLANNQKLASMLAAFDGTAKAYVCENYTCQAPVSTSEALQEALDKSR